MVARMDTISRQPPKRINAHNCPSGIQQQKSCKFHLNGNWCTWIYCRITSKCKKIFIGGILIWGEILPWCHTGACTRHFIRRIDNNLLSNKNYNYEHKIWRLVAIAVGRSHVQGGTHKAQMFFGVTSGHSNSADEQSYRHWSEWTLLESLEDLCLHLLSIFLNWEMDVCLLAEIIKHRKNPTLKMMSLV